MEANLEWTACRSSRIESTGQQKLPAKAAIHFAGTLKPALFAEGRGAIALLEQRRKLQKDKCFTQLCSDTPRNKRPLRKKYKKSLNKIIYKGNIVDVDKHQ